jgi:hypothetical protein
MLAAALFALGLFAAIYHPVGTAMLIETATQRGRSLAFNGVCGNLGVSLAAGITAALTAAFSWRGAFLVPGLIAIATGVAYVWLAPDEERHASKRSSAPDAAPSVRRDRAHPVCRRGLGGPRDRHDSARGVALSMPAAVAIFALFMVVALTAGLVFNTLTVALPKIVDERIGGGIPLVVVGGLSTAVFLCGGLAQIAVGRLVERFPPHLLFAAIALIQFAGVAWAVRATGTTLLVALAVTMAAIYGQITVNDLVIARYTADAWRGRVYAVRYFFTFMVSGVAVSMIAILYGRGGFDLVLGVTAAVALALFVAVVFIAVIANGVERTRVPHPVPAE